MQVWWEGSPHKAMMKFKRWIGSTDICKNIHCIFNLSCGDNALIHKHPTSPLTVQNVMRNNAGLATVWRRYECASKPAVGKLTKGTSSPLYVFVNPHGCADGLIYLVIFYSKVSKASLFSCSATINAYTGTRKHRLSKRLITWCRMRLNMHAVMI